MVWILKIIGLSWGDIIFEYSVVKEGFGLFSKFVFL